MKKVLLLDIGNSMVDCFLFIDGKGYFYNFPSRGEHIYDDLLKYTNSIMENVLADVDIYISSVNRFALNAITGKLGNNKISILQKEDMKSYVERKSYTISNIDILSGDLFADIVGDDSIANTIIIDLGTATKVLASDNSSTFLGGMIYPGIYSCSKILANKTDLLQDQNISLPDSLVSTDTEEAINAGAIYGTALMVKGFALEIAKDYDLQNPKIVVTGGGGAIIAEAFKKIGYTNFVYDRFRIIRGIANAFCLDDLLKETILYEKR